MATENTAAPIAPCVAAERAPAHAGEVRSLASLVGLVALVGLTACGGARSTARHWASRDLGCPPREITATPIAIDVFEVEGCGQRALYRCPNRDACERLGVSEEEPAARADASAAGGEAARQNDQESDRQSGRQNGGESTRESPDALAPPR